MATKRMAFFQVLASFIFLAVFPQNSCDASDDAPKLKQCRFNAIYSFGDSTSDTGNQIIEIPQVWHTKLPYGQTIHKATGRGSDGLLMIDYIDCQEKLASSLFIAFAGSNDYSSALSQNKTIDEVKNVLVPQSVEVLKHAVKKFIQLGARRVLVNGLSPSGCTPGFLTRFSSNNSANSYDGFGCLKNYNDLNIYHNDRLKEGIEELKKEHPHVDIVYGDLYGAMQWLLDNSQQLGFKSLTKACCGAPSKYNVIEDFYQMCGAPKVPVCQKPKHNSGNVCGGLSNEGLVGSIIYVVSSSDLGNRVV
ncbi:unnamed protein product [Dovyalis caffra]|uniref:GDSL esterase/lipase n=1 Tax=Dovyalis caffra TaxID=77055 RepID=A0AAV1RVC5_9ROSI|nr:unnamed protein product [Dovyalis caffra]